MQETRVQSLGWEDPLEKRWQPTSVFLPGKSHGWRSLTGYSPWGHKELDTIERPPHTETSEDGGCHQYTLGPWRQLKF